MKAQHIENEKKSSTEESRLQLLETFKSENTFFKICDMTTQSLPCSPHSKECFKNIKNLTRKVDKFLQSVTRRHANGGLPPELKTIEGIFHKYSIVPNSEDLTLERHYFSESTKGFNLTTELEFSTPVPVLKYTENFYSSGSLGNHKGYGIKVTISNRGPCLRLLIARKSKHYVLLHTNANVMFFKSRNAISTPQIFKCGHSRDISFGFSYTNALWKEKLLTGRGALMTKDDRFLSDDPVLKDLEASDNKWKDLLHYRTESDLFWDAAEGSVEEDVDISGDTSTEIFKKEFLYKEKVTSYWDDAEIEEVMDTVSLKNLKKAYASCFPNMVALEEKLVELELLEKESIPITSLQMFSNFDIFKKSRSELKEVLTEMPEKLVLSLKEHLTQPVMGELKQTGGLVLLTLTGCYVLDYCVNGVLPSKTTALAIAAVSAGIYGPNIISFVSKYLKAPETELQMDSFEDYVRSFMTSMLSLWPDVGMKKLKDYVYLISNFEKLRDGIMVIITWFFEHIDKICTYLLNRKAIPSNWYARTITDKEILAFLDRINAFSEDLKSDKIPYTVKSLHIVKELLAECVQIKSQLSRNSGKGNVIETCYKKLAEIETSFGSIDPNVAGYRVEPATLLFRGPPGINKSTLLDFVLEGMKKRFTPVEADPNQYVNIGKDSKFDVKNGHSSIAFYRQITNDFWDGYRNHPVTVYDDFGQVRDVAGVPNSVFNELINAKNTTPYQLHMSKISDKSDTYFRSKMILGSTNVFDFKPQSIMEPRAIDRRWDIDIEVSVKREFSKNPDQDAKNRVFDHSTLEQKDGVSVLKPEYYTFSIRTYSEDGISYEVSTFEEVMKRLNFKLDFFEKCHKQNLESKRKVAEMCDRYGITNDTKEGPTLTLGNIIEEFPHEDDAPLRDFFAKFTQKFGNVYGKYLDLMKRMNLKHGVQWIKDIFVYKNVDMWVSECGNELQMCSFDMTQCITEIESFTSLPEEEVKVLKETMLSAKTSLGICLTVSAIFVGYKWYTENDIVPMTSTQSPTRVMQSKHKGITSMEQLRELYSTPQIGNLDSNGDQLMDSIIKRNTYTLCCGEKQYGMVLCLGSTVYLMPSHYTITFASWVQDESLGFSDSTVLWFKRNKYFNDTFSHFSISVRELLMNIIPDEILEGKDMCAVRLPDHFPKGRNIVSHFKTTFKDIYNTARVDSVRYINGTPKYETQFTQLYKLDSHRISWFGQTREFTNVYHARINTYDGQCGSIVSEVNAKSAAKIIGIHVAGQVQGRHGISQIVSQQDVMRVMATASKDRVLITDMLEEETVLQMSDSHEINDFDAIKRIDGLTSDASVSWKKSEFFGLFQQPLLYPSIVKPVMREGTLINPRLRAVEGYSRNSGIFIDPEVFDLLLSSEMDYFSQHRKLWVEDRVLTTEEAICGISDECDFGPLSRRSSPGYPYVLERKGTKGKSLWFGSEETYNLDTEKCKELLVKVEEQEALLKKGILPVYIFMENVKDELRSIAKVQAIRPRNFSNGPQDLVIIFKKYFGSFVISCIKNRLDNGLTIGINPYSNEWHILALLLLEKNTVVNAGDFKDYDKSNCPRICQGILSIVESFYTHSTEEERLIRKTLWCTLTRSYHLIEGIVYAWDGSMSSGHYLTAIVNSLYNRIVHKYCFYDLCGRNVSLLWRFNEVVYIAPHGDDSLMTVIPEFQEQYNEVTLPSSMIKLGLIYTPETKEVSDGKKRSILEVSYLKRGFRYENLVQGFVAPMKLERIFDMVNWTKKEDGDLIMIAKCEIISREWSLHGELVFNRLIKILQKALYEVYRASLKNTNFHMVLLEVANSEIIPEISNLQMLDPSNDMNMIKQENVATALLGRTYLVSQESYMSKELYNHLCNSISMLQMEVEKGDTKVVDDGDVAVITDPSSSRINSLMSLRTNNYSMGDIKRVLERPLVIVSGSFAASDTATTFAAIAYTTILQSAMFAEKLKGIHSIKADLVLTLEVNANPFQTGLYKLNFLYNGGVTVGASDAYYRQLHRGSVAQVIQLHGIYINLGCETAVTLKVPFRSSFDGVIIHSTAGYQNIGEAFIYPIFPVSAPSGALTATYSLLAHFENIELGAPSVLQMAKKSKSVDLIAAEQEDRPVSKMLTMGSQVAGALARVPLLSNIATPLSWVLEASSKAARVWGFSKPNVVSYPSRMVDIIDPYGLTYDGADAAEPMSFSVGNHVESNNAVFGTEMDEMSISSLVQREGYVTTATWLDTNAKDVIVYGVNLTPLNFITTVTDSAVTMYLHTPLAFPRLYFTQWTGSFIFKFRIAKTKFHSGRLIFAFTPNTMLFTAAAPTLATANSTYSFRTIWDVREADEFEVTVPYINTSPWCTNEDEMGTIALIVLDPLISPASVNNDVQILVTVRGGPDFKYAAPGTHTYAPCLISALQMDSTCEETSGMVGDSQLTRMDYPQESLTQGQVITSLRQVLKIYHPVINTPTNIAQTTSVLYLPFHSYLHSSSGAAILGTVANVSNDPWSMFCAMYAMNRGGVRLSLFPTLPVAGNTLLMSLNHVGSGAGSLSSLVVATTETIAVYLYNNTNAGIRGSIYNNARNTVFIPQNTTSVNRSCFASILTTALVAAYDQGNADMSQLRVRQTGSSGLNHVWLRAGADDASFGCFVSVPHVVVATAPA